MIRWNVARALVLVACAGTAFGTEYSCRKLTVDTQLFYADSSGFGGEGRVLCFDEYMGSYKGEFIARTWVVDESVAATVSEDSCPKCLTDAWVGGTGGLTTPGHCYRSRASGSCSFDSQEVGSGAKCAPSATQPPPGGGSGCTPTETNPCSGPGVTYNYRDCGYFYGEWTGCNSPIVINVASGSYELTGPLNPVTFDLDADGSPDVVTWTAPLSGIAFLALDRNHNGRIDDGGELFGNHTRLTSSMDAANGFEALSEFDLNHDGVINAADPIWPSLLLWTDRDHDGKSSAEELKPVASSTIVAIDLRYHWSGRRDRFGNMFRYEAETELKGGTRPIYDVFFRIRE
jgi:hypothetical protein